MLHLRSPDTVQWIGEWHIYVPFFQWNVQELVLGGAWGELLPLSGTVGNWAASLWAHHCYYKVDGWDSILKNSPQERLRSKMLTGQEMHCSISLVNFKSDADTFEHDPLSVPVFNCSSANWSKPALRPRGAAIIAVPPKSVSFAGLSHRRLRSSHPFVTNQPCLWVSIPIPNLQYVVYAVHSVPCKLSPWRGMFIWQTIFGICSNGLTRTDWPLRQRKYKKLHSVQCIAESFFQHISY